MNGRRRILTTFLFLFILTASVSAQETDTDDAEVTAADAAPATYDAYIVQRGESLFSIARQFNVTVDALRQANNYSEDRQLIAGQTILVPTGVQSYVEVYQVLPGDTLFGISKRFNTTLGILQGLNDIPDGRHIEVGQNILVPSLDQAALIVYQVVENDSLFSIAKRFSTAVSLLRTLNGIGDDSDLEAGQTILVPKIDEQRFETYEITESDSLYGISRRFATTEDALISLNGLASALDIQAGQSILVPRIDETKYEVYVVEEGDTLFHISRLYNTTVAQLRALNGVGGRLDLAVGRSILVPKVDESIFKRYIVKPGDSLYSISRRFDVSLAALQALNRLADVRSIQVDQAILLPILENETLDVYVVQLGDTLAKIAEAHNTTVQYLQSLNGINDPSLILLDETIVVPKPAELVVRPGFGFGIQVFIDGANASALADLVTRLGVNWVKIDVPWADIEKEQGVFQFSALDSMIAAMELANVNIMLNIYAAPDWSRTSYIETLNSRMRDYTGPPENLVHLSSFLANLVTRYAGLVDAYEIWKSPNLLKYWTVPVYHRTPEKTADGDYGVPDEIHLGANIYVRLLEVAYDTIKSHDQDALVITGGLAPVGFSDNYNSIDTGTYLNDMLLHGAADISDGVGVIFSASAVPPSLRCCDKPPGVDSHYESFLQYFTDLLDFYNDALETNGLSEMPLFVTQVGWGTREGTNLAIPSSGFEWLNYTSEAEQALYVTQAYEIVQNQGYPAAMFLYNLNGCSVGDEEACFFSLIDAAGAHRPALSQFADIPKTPDAA